MDSVTEAVRMRRSFADASRGVIDKSSAASASAEDPPKGRAFPDATVKQAGKIGAASASAEDPPTEREGNGYLGAARSATSVSVEDRITKKKGHDPSSAALGPVGKACAGSASEEEDKAMRGSIGHGRVTASVPSSRRGSGRGDGSGCLKPNSPKR